VLIYIGSGIGAAALAALALAVVRRRGLTVPLNVTLGLGATACMLPLAWIFAPASTSAFYEAAVQIIPVFLVALAVEQSFSESLGTESAFIQEARSRVKADYIEPAEFDVALASFEGALGRRGTGTGRLHDFELSVPKREYEKYRDLADGSYLAQWQWLIAKVLKADKGLSDRAGEEARVEAADARLPIVAALALHDLAGVPRFTFTNAEDVNGRDIMFFIDKLRKSANDGLLTRLQLEAERDAVGEYRDRKAARRLSTLFAISLLAAAELVAFVGLLSPGESYRALFGVSAALFTGSFVAVTTGAAQQLLDD
jgi:hypothetical protein